ncbi:hypothetical protein MHO82_20370 [Vibrio sp. Of7-15]|uniref:hypothetical protein n=1 Tax=Vibrio sp. Of7-15 TaxID=2724879 RepID=UPI001EF3D07B|nr:hypothetical protein [Vibrio sp. Of7-15]MCG7499225.1 hypothetical protein [Vibrio sp. Of7-15]
MLKRFIILLFIFSANLSFAASTEHKEFELSLFQEGIEIPLNSDTISLKKEPFVLQFKFKKELWMLVNAYHDEESFLQAKKGLPYKEIIGFTYTGMAESKYNPNEYFTPSKKGPHFWGYDSPSRHRCDARTIGIKGDETICRRTISQFTNENGDYTPLKDYPHDELNFVFIPFSQREDVTARQLLKIQFK